jgi:hypothetical protein
MSVTVGENNGNALAWKSLWSVPEVRRRLINQGVTKRLC